MQVIFSDNKTYIFTEYQLIRIPYFEVLINSPTWLENKSNKIIINHNSIGFDFIHIFATMDEIDILDPGDNYLFVMKQCDYFCYDKLKILLDSKYGFRKIVSDTNNNIGKETIMKYLGSFKIYINTHNSREYIKCIVPIYEHEIYSNDNEINEIYIKRYKSKMLNYYFDLIKKVYYKREMIINNEINNNHSNNETNGNNVDYEIIFAAPGLNSPSIELLSNKYFYKVDRDKNVPWSFPKFTIIAVYEKI